MCECAVFAAGSGQAHSSDK